MIHSYVDCIKCIKLLLTNLPCDSVVIASFLLNSLQPSAILLQCKIQETANNSLQKVCLMLSCYDNK